MRKIQTEGKEWEESRNNDSLKEVRKDNRRRGNKIHKSEKNDQKERERK